MAKKRAHFGTAIDVSKHDRATTTVKVIPQPLSKLVLQKGRVGKKPVAMYLDMETRKQLKMLVIEQDNRTQESMLIEALNDLFEKYKKPRIA